MSHIPSPARYDNPGFHRHCGRSGSSSRPSRWGCGTTSAMSMCSPTRARWCCGPLILGITHFDLANNYGPPPGSAEENFGRLLRDDLAPYRDELVISTKAGYTMLARPLRRLGFAQIPAFLTGPEPATDGAGLCGYLLLAPSGPEHPVEETMGALAQAVRSGKALYAALSNYPPDKTRRGGPHSARIGHALPHPPAEVSSVRAPD